MKKEEVESDSSSMRMSKSRFQSSSKSGGRETHPQSRESETENINTPSHSQLESNSKRGHFKKYNSNRFNTVNISGGSVNRSQHPSHSSIKSKYQTRHSIDLEKQYLLQK